MVTAQTKLQADGVSEQHVAANIPSDLKSNSGPMNRRARIIK